MLLKDKLIETRNKIDSPDAEIIFQHVLKIDKAKIYSDIKKEINKKDLSSIDLIVEERLKGKPLAYLIGKKGFWKNSFIVTPDVLVPRPETETLVDAILKENLQGKTLLELGTGSGAIGMSIAKEKPFWTCTLTDKSFEALSVARENMKALNLKNSVLIQHDWNKRWLFEPMDLIISNPPYIYRNDLDGDEDGIWFEPPSALFSEKKGLADISTIVKNVLLS